MGFLKTCKKYMFPGHFKTLIENIKEAFDEHNNNDKQHMYLKLKKEFEKIKKEKNNSCNNNNSTRKNNSDDKKKIAIVVLLFTVLENDIDFNKLEDKYKNPSTKPAEHATIASKIRKIREELDSVEEKLDVANTTINSVHTSKDFLTKKVKELLNNIDIQLEAIAYVNSISNKGNNSVSAQLEKRLKKLMSSNGGNRTRKNRSK